MSLAVFIMLDYEGVEDPEIAVPRSARYMRGILHLLQRQQLLSELSSEPSDGVGGVDGVGASAATESTMDPATQARSAFRSEASIHG